MNLRSKRMKRLIKNVLAASVVAAMAVNVAACSKTEETVETSESVAETSVVETTVQTTEVTETAVSSQTAETGNVEIEYIELDSDLQTYANTFVSNFAEQFLTDIDRDSATPEQLLDFVHIHLKINSNDSISYMTNGDLTFETFTFETAQIVVRDYFGILLSDVTYNGLPTPPESFGDQPAGPYAADGSVWYEAADGEMHNLFAVVDYIMNNYDGTLTLAFTVYSIDYDTFYQLDMNALRAYYSLTADEASADSTLSPVTTGTAVVDVGQSGDYYLISYHTDI